MGAKSGPGRKVMGVRLGEMVGATATGGGVDPSAVKRGGSPLVVSLLQPAARATIFKQHTCGRDNERRISLENDLIAIPIHQDSAHGESQDSTFPDGSKGCVHSNALIIGVCRNCNQPGDIELRR